MNTMQEQNLTPVVRTFRAIGWICLVFALTFAGCSGGTSKSPPKQNVQDTVRASLPQFLTLDSIELEPIPTGPEDVKVNFKATVTPKEDLYQIDREVEGTPKVTLLKVVQPAGIKASLYGSVAAHRTMDQWSIQPPQIDVGLRQFGMPRAAFDAQSYVTGSNDANEALRQQATNAEKIAQAKEAARAERERERKALEEQKAREEEARKKREEQTRVALEMQRQKEAEQRRLEKLQREREAAPAELAKIEKMIQAKERGLATCRRVAMEYRLSGLPYGQAEKDASAYEREIAELKARQLELMNLLSR